ncbi:MAG: hypothetical protein ABW146_13800 [Candidatus Sedimenticola sp. 6PFRAG7]
MTVRKISQITEAFGGRRKKSWALKSAALPIFTFIWKAGLDIYGKILVVLDFISAIF